MGDSVNKFKTLLNERDYRKKKVRDSNVMQNSRPKKLA